MTRAEQLRAPSPAFLLKFATALLMTFAAALVLVQAEIYFSHPLVLNDFVRELF